MTRQGAMETKVESMVRRRTHSSKTTCGTPQECSPSAAQSVAATNTAIPTLPSPPSTPMTTRKPQLGSTIVTPSPLIPSSSTFHTTGIPHPSDLPHPTSPIEGYYLVIVGQEVSIYYTWYVRRFPFTQLIGSGLNTQERCSNAGSQHQWRGLLQVQDFPAGPRRLHSRLSQGRTSCNSHSWWTVLADCAAHALAHSQ